MLGDGGRGGAGGQAPPRPHADPERARMQGVGPRALRFLWPSRAPSPCVISICALAHGRMSWDPSAERVPVSSGCHELSGVTLVGWRRHAGGPRVCMCDVRTRGRRCFSAGPACMAPLSWLVKCHCPRGGLSEVSLLPMLSSRLPRDSTQPQRAPPSRLGDLAGEHLTLSCRKLGCGETWGSAWICRTPRTPSRTSPVHGVCRAAIFPELSRCLGPDAAVGQSEGGGQDRRRPLGRPLFMGLAWPSDRPLETLDGGSGAGGCIGKAQPPTGLHM